LHNHAFDIFCENRDNMVGLCDQSQVSLFGCLFGSSAAYLALSEIPSSNLIRAEARIKSSLASFFLVLFKRAISVRSLRNFVL
jgi:hypothetical protein